MLRNFPWLIKTIFNDRDLRALTSIIHYIIKQFTLYAKFFNYTYKIVDWKFRDQQLNKRWVKQLLLPLDQQLPTKAITTKVLLGVIRNSCVVIGDVNAYTLINMRLYIHIWRAEQISGTLSYWHYSAIN